MWAKAEVRALDMFAGQGRGRCPRDDNLAQEDVALSPAPTLAPCLPLPFCPEAIGSRGAGAGHTVALQTKPSEV